MLDKCKCGFHLLKFMVVWNSHIVLKLNFLLALFRLFIYQLIISFVLPDVEKERSLLANVPPNMYESNVCLPELPDYIPPPAHHYNNNNNSGK